MFSSGLVKLASGDPAWRDLTALTYHYETQPLPTWIGWFVHRLPAGFQQFSCGFMFATELGIPFLLFGPRPFRIFSASVLIFFQVLILLTGNYCFFNLLAIALCLLAMEDSTRPESVSAVLRSVSGFRTVNSYGLFAVMTTSRPEIVVEGSKDGMRWEAYEFKWKPGDLKRPPQFVIPHQPRLDWQMWFAARSLLPRPASEIAFPDI